MDSLTHIALGACMGEIFAGKALGKKAMLWGAVAQSLPDIDVVASLWLKPPETLLAHRGITHSILFCTLATIGFILIAMRVYKQYNIPTSRWVLFFSVAVFGHIFIDAFNNYGTGWFEPFNHARISFQTIYVADPFFSLWPVIALIVLVVLRRSSASRIKWAYTGLGLSCLYLVYALFNKATVDKDVKQALQNQQVTYTRYFTTPAPLQSWLWFVVAGNDSGYNVGFRSVFDSKDQISFQYFSRNDYLLDSIRTHKDVQELIRFSQQYYTADNWNDTLVFNDLRFGQVLGWENQKGRFAFHYYLQYPDDNSMVVQRGRFEGWNNQTLQSFIKRIKGN